MEMQRHLELPKYFLKKSKVEELTLFDFKNYSRATVIQTAWCWDFPGDPVVMTLCFQRRGHTFNSWSRNWDPTCHAVWPKTNQKNNCMVLAPKLTNSSVERIKSSELYTYVGNLFLTKVQKKRQGSRKRITFSRKLCARIVNIYDPLHQKKKKKKLGSILYITYKKINLKRTLGLNVNVKPKIR